MPWHLHYVSTLGSASRRTEIMLWTPWRKQEMVGGIQRLRRSCTSARIPSAAPLKIGVMWRKDVAEKAYLPYSTATIKTDLQVKPALPTPVAGKAQVKVSDNLFNPELLILCHREAGKVLKNLDESIRTGGLYHGMFHPLRDHFRRRDGGREECDITDQICRRCVSNTTPVEETSRQRNG